MQASVLNLRELKAPHEGAKMFKLRIIERGTRFYENVDIDEDRQLAYFNLPAHNGLQSTEELYDFKMNITIRRSKVDSVCYVKPLPEDVSRPKELTRAFSESVNRPPNYRISTISKYWIPTEEVDKNFLRREAREFCDQYPIYRLEEYKFNSVSVENDIQSAQSSRIPDMMDRWTDGQLENHSQLLCVRDFSNESLFALPI